MTGCTTYPDRIQGCFQRPQNDESVTFMPYNTGPMIETHQDDVFRLAQIAATIYARAPIAADRALSS